MKNHWLRGVCFERDPKNGVVTITIDGVQRETCVAPVSFVGGTVRITGDGLIELTIRKDRQAATSLSALFGAPAPTGDSATVVVRAATPL